jgi:hypothetical protein
VCEREHETADGDVDEVCEHDVGASPDLLCGFLTARLFAFRGPLTAPERVI